MQIFVCNDNVTLPPKTNPCGAFRGSPSATALRPDPVDLISDPLGFLENICIGRDACGGEARMYRAMNVPKGAQTIEKE